MLYEVDINILTTNTVNNKQETIINLTHGVIHQLGIYFPPGCTNLAHVAINRGLNQIFPTNPEGSIKGDGLNVEGTTFHPIIKAPYQVEVYTWNTNAIYDHIVTVRIWLLKIWQLMPLSDEMFTLSLTESVGSLPGP